VGLEARESGSIESVGSGSSRRRRTRAGEVLQGDFAFLPLPVGSNRGGYDVCERVDPTYRRRILERKGGGKAATAKPRTVGLHGDGGREGGRGADD
jgi:hypothetical protein